MKQIFLICAAMVLLGCGKKAPEQQAEPKVELTEAKLTPGMEAALKADEAGNYQGKRRGCTSWNWPQKKPKSAPSWVQLSYLHNELGLADNAGLYDKALAAEESTKLGPSPAGNNCGRVSCTINMGIAFVHNARPIRQGTGALPEITWRSGSNNWGRSILMWPTATTTSG